MESAFGGPQLSNSPFGTTNGLGADILQPLSLDPLAAQQRPILSKPLTGDVDTSLSRAAENLSEGTGNEWGLSGLEMSVLLFVLQAWSLVLEAVDPMGWSKGVCLCVCHRCLLFVYVYLFCCSGTFVCLLLLFSAIVFFFFFDLCLRFFHACFCLCMFQLMFLCICLFMPVLRMFLCMSVFQLCFMQVIVYGGFC